MPTHILILLSLAAVCIGATESRAQDVYNFYFQKNTAAQAPLGPLVTTPATGSSSQSAAPLPTQLPATTVQTDVKRLSPVKADFRRFDVTVAKAQVISPTVTTYQVTEDNLYNDKYKGVEARDAYSLVLSYRFNRFVASDFGLTYSTSWKNSDPLIRGMGKGVDLDGNLGIALTPIHINFFGYELIEIGVLGGLMTQTKFELFEKFDAGEGTFKNKSKIVVPYLGPRLAVNLTQELGLVLDGRIRTDNSGIASLGLKYRF